METVREKKAVTTIGDTNSAQFQGSDVKIMLFGTFILQKDINKQEEDKEKNTPH